MAEEIIVVGFAGGGGSCEGIKEAIGRSPHVAINHDEVAVAVHRANHPDTIHYCKNIFKADPMEVLRDVKREHKLKALPKIGMGWFSPDCSHHSRARGGKPRQKNIRDLPWVILAWAKLPAHLRPRLFFIENVTEYLDWGPLDADGHPIPDRKGESFKRWVSEFKRRGYKVEWRRIKAANKKTPTTRERLYIIMRNDGLPIVWPEDSCAAPKSPYVISGKREPWPTAAECIDWTLPCPSIFDTSEQIKKKFGLRSIRPLAENTQARIARGIYRYVIDCPDPFIVPINGVPHEVMDISMKGGEPSGHVGPFVVPITHHGDTRAHDIRDPMRTTTAAHRGEHALVTPFLAGVGSRAGQSPPRAADAPAPTATATKRGQHAVIAPVLVKNNHGDKPHYRADEPVRAIVAGGNHHMLVAPTLIQHYGDGDGGLVRASSPDTPLPTVTASPRHSVVAAFLAQHNYMEPGHDAREPMSTIVQRGCTQAVVSAGLMSLKSEERRSSPITMPMPGICAQGNHIAEVRAFLMKFHRDGGQLQGADIPLGAIPTHDSFGLVTVWIGGEPFIIVDIGMRMLTPRELFTANGMRRDYIIDRGLWPDGTWKPITKTQQVRLCGNMVCPPVAKCLVKANYEPQNVNARGVPAFALEAAE